MVLRRRRAEPGLGADSLDFVDLVFAIEKRFGVKVRDDELDVLSQLDFSSPEVMRDGFLTRAVIERSDHRRHAVRDGRPEGGILAEMIRAARFAMWTLVLAKMVGAWGLTWDIQWHLRIGRDSFWIAPHVMMYSGVTAGFVVSFGVLALETWRTRGGRPRPGTLRVAGLVGTRGFHLAAWGVALVILAAPIDDLWHRLFGLDVTLWSPPHLLGLLGTAINTIGTMLAATEVYPASSATRWAALLLTGALLYGGTRVVLEPAWLTAYLHGGILFHCFGLLGALVLPIALAPGARLLDRRWAPIALVAVALAVSTSGEQIARAGFAILQPVSVIGEAIVKDPTSTIAQASAIREKSRGSIAPLWVRLLLPLGAAAVMSALDIRRRAALAGAAYGVALLALYGWSISTSPAYAPLVPSPAETAVAVAIAALAGAAGGQAGRALADTLGERPSETHAAARSRPAATSPAR